MRIVVAGSHGMIGGALLPALRDGGHEVVRLVRRAADGPDEISWDPDLGKLDATSLDDVDAVVNLAGVNVGERPLTRERKRAVLTSRIRTTALLSRTLAAADRTRARVLLQGSAIGAYGDRGDDVLTESEPYGDTFFADVVRRWEAATTPAERAGVRVVHLRTGVVLAPQGGALGRLLPLIKAGVGGPLGSGRQFWSWITLPDEVRAIEHLLRAGVEGPVNLVAEPTRNAEVTEALARAFGRPARIAVPAVALRLVLGDFAPEILGSVRAVPAVLSADGFRFSHPDIAAAATWIKASPAR
ncbi:MAG: TIGR01777 family oxidoreductase [Cellulomonas sp.]|nr:TIGR01777 family oxidoreductase [Cellulomonas sp.]